MFFVLSEAWNTHDKLFVFLYFQNMENLRCIVFDYHLWFRRGNKHFDVHFRIRPVQFPSKKWKRRGLWGWKGMERFLFSQSGRFSIVNNMIKVLFPTLYLDLVCKQLGFPPKRGMNRKNESTYVIIINCTVCHMSYLYHYSLPRYQKLFS